MAWYWGCGLGFAILFMSGIDLLHRNLGSWNSQRIPRVSTSLCARRIGNESCGPVPDTGRMVTAFWRLR